MEKQEFLTTFGEFMTRLSTHIKTIDVVEKGYFYQKDVYISDIDEAIRILNELKAWLPEKVE